MNPHRASSIKSRPQAEGTLVIIWSLSHMTIQCQIIVFTTICSVFLRQIYNMLEPMHLAMSGPCRPTVPSHQQEPTPGQRTKESHKFPVGPITNCVAVSPPTLSNKNLSSESLKPHLSRNLNLLFGLSATPVRSHSRMIICIERQDWPWPLHPHAQDTTHYKIRSGEETV